jgi:four helix bundle protein
VISIRKFCVPAGFKIERPTEFNALHRAHPVLVCGGMTPHELRQRTKIFAIAVIRFCRALPKTDEARVISWQLLRCGPAVGANYRAVCRCRSDKDFIAKLGVVIEEADETAFWLEVLAAAAIVKAIAITNLYKEADELTRIFVSSRETARRNRRLKRRGQTPKSNASENRNH